MDIANVGPLSANFCTFYLKLVVSHAFDSPNIPCAFIRNKIIHRERVLSDFDSVKSFWLGGAECAVFACTVKCSLSSPNRCTLYTVQLPPQLS